MTTPEADHRALAVAYFNATWDLIDAPDRNDDADRRMLSCALASRQHWADAAGTEENRCVADWQVAHAASLAGHASLALSFARAAVERADGGAGLPAWVRASAHEGMARAFAASGEVAGYEREAAIVRALLEEVDDPEDSALVASQLAAIPRPPG